jgi:hypothetical protein
MAANNKRDTALSKIDKVKRYLVRTIHEDYNQYLAIVPQEQMTQETLGNFWSKIRHKIEVAIRQYNETNSDHLYVQDYKLKTADVAMDAQNPKNIGQYLDLELYYYETEIDADGRIQLRYTCSVNSCKSDLKNKKPYQISIDSIEYDLCEECYVHLQDFVQVKMRPGRKKQIAQQQWERFKKEQLEKVKRGPSMLINLNSASQEVINRELDGLEPVSESELEDLFADLPPSLDMEDDS